MGQLHSAQPLDRLVGCKHTADTGDEPGVAVGRSHGHIPHAGKETFVADPVATEVDFEDSMVGGRLHTSSQEPSPPYPHEVQY